MLFFIFLSCAEKEENLPPTVSINIQEEDLKLLDGYEVQLRADVSDPNDTLDELSVRWLVGGVTACDWTLGGSTVPVTAEDVVNEPAKGRALGSGVVVDAYQLAH